MTETPQSSGNKSPEHLTEGQNFYDQPPFSPILHDVSTKTHVDLARLRKLLTLLSREYSRPYRRGNLPEGKLTAQELSIQMQNLSPEVVQRSGSVGATEHEAIRLLGMSLAACPLWSDYIASRLDRTDYDDEGVSVQRIGKYLPITTYATWTTNTIMRDERFKFTSENIETVLPRGYGNPNPGLPSSKGRRK